jgi:hypothetical protein
MTDGVGVSYEIFFPSEADVARPRRQLEDAGCEVTSAVNDGPAEAPHGLTASVGAVSEETGSALIESALAGVQHHPEILYQVTRLTGFTKPRPYPPPE